MIKIKTTWFFSNHFVCHFYFAFKHFDFIKWFSSNSNSNILLERLSIKDLLVNSSVNFLFDFINVIVYFTNFNKNIKFFTIRINSNKFTIKFFFYFIFSVFFFYQSICCFSLTSIANLWSGRYRLILLPKTKYCSIN